MSASGPMPRFTAQDASALLRAGTPIVQSVGAWALLGRPVEEASGAWSFRTASLDGSVAHTDAGVMLIVRADDLILPLVKRAGNTAFSSIVLIGRASSNDVVIPHGSVSKLHARVEQTAEGISFEDMGSANGTTINGVELGAQQKRVGGSGAQVSFGKCTFTLLSAAELERILRSLR